MRVMSRFPGAWRMGCEAPEVKVNTVAEKLGRNAYVVCEATSLFMRYIVHVYA